MEKSNTIKRTKRVYSIIIMIVFLILIYFPITNYFFHYSAYEKVSKRENRNLAEMPKIDIEKLDPFPSEFEKYYNDHFIYRDKILYWHTLLSYYLLQRSPVPEKVALGKNSWLYYTDKERKVFEGKFQITDEDIQEIVSEIKFRDSVYKSKGIQFVVMITPMKAEVYPEYLPTYYRRLNSDDATDKVVKALHKINGLSIIYPKPELIEAKKLIQTYYKYDNHWNRAGAYYAYRKLIETINKTLPNSKAKLLNNNDLKLENKDVPGGNLANMIGLDNLLRETDYFYSIRNQKSKEGIKRNYPITSGFAYESEYEMVSVNSDTTLPKALIIRDSYCVALMPYLNESFGEVIYIFDAWQYKLNMEIIEKEKPDVIILQIFEPHISNLLDNLSKTENKL